MAWGRRDIVIRKTDDLLSRMNYEPAAYVMHYSPARAEDFRTFRHRTFNQTDIHSLLSSLHCIYTEFEDFEAFWISCSREAYATGRPLLSRAAACQIGRASCRERGEMAGGAVAGERQSRDDNTKT